MTQEQVSTLGEIRRLMYEAMEDYLTRFNDGHKSSECGVDVHYPNHFEYPDDLMRADGLSIYSYALGPTRNHDFSVGDPRRSSLGSYYAADPFALALDTVKRWHAAEMARPDGGDPEEAYCPVIDGKISQASGEAA